jgi:hypothetical protein
MKPPHGQRLVHGTRWGCFAVGQWHVPLFSLCSKACVAKRRQWTLQIPAYRVRCEPDHVAPRRVQQDADFDQGLPTMSVCVGVHMCMCVMGVVHGRVSVSACAGVETEEGRTEKERTDFLRTTEQTPAQKSVVVAFELVALLARILQPCVATDKPVMARSWQGCSRMPRGGG